MSLAPQQPLVLPPRVARDVVASAFDELRVSVDAPPEQIAASFRALSLQRALGMSAGSSGSSGNSGRATSNNNNNNSNNNSNNNNNNNNNDSHESFQRQAVAYRFLSSLPLLDDTEYRPEHMLATLRPLAPATSDEASERASALLDVAIASMELAQRAYALPYTNYVITVHYWLHTHVVRRRYSEFVALHRVLVRKLPVVPELPPRDWRYKWRLQPPNDARPQLLTQYLLRVVQSLAARGLFSLDVMDFLGVDVRRVRAHEEALAVHYLSTAGSSNSTGYYIVCSGWLATWKRFVQSGAVVATTANGSDGHTDTDASSSEQLRDTLVTTRLPPPPGKISNDLLIDAATQKPKDALAPARHYRCVNAATWQYLTRVYGVRGPTLARVQATIYSRTIVDTNALATHLQALVRGFLGRCAAQRRRLHVAHLQPTTQVHMAVANRQQLLTHRMAVVRRYVAVREFQVRHVAARRIQRAFRAFILRAEHALLLAESAMPGVDSAFARAHEYCPLDAVATLRDPQAKLAFGLLALAKGVALQMLRTRWALSQSQSHLPWRLVAIDAIASQLQWRSAAHAHALAFVDVVQVAIEAPVVLTTILGRRATAPSGLAQAVVVTYYIGSSGRKSSNSDVDDRLRRNRNAHRELVLVCATAGECEALHGVLSAVVAETQARVAHGASYVDGHGAIRRRVPHAKRLLREAQEWLDEHAASRVAVESASSLPLQPLSQQPQRVLSV